MASSDKTLQTPSSLIDQLSNRELFYLLPPEMQRDLVELMSGVLASVSHADIVDALTEFNHEETQRTLRAYIEKQGVMGIVFKRPDPARPSKINLVVRHQFMLEDVVRRYLHGGRLFALAGLHVKQVRVIFGNRLLDNPDGNCLVTVNTAQFPFKPRSPKQDDFRHAVAAARQGDDLALQLILRSEPDKLKLLTHSGLPYEIQDGEVHLAPPPRRGEPLAISGVAYQSVSPEPAQPVEIQADNEARQMLLELVTQLLQRLRNEGHILQLMPEHSSRTLVIIYRYRTDFFMYAGQQGIVGAPSGGGGLELRLLQRLEDLGKLGQRLVHFINTQVMTDSRSGILETEELIGFVLTTAGLRGFLLGKYQIDCVVPPLSPGKQSLPDNLWLYQKDAPDVP